jgi:putative phosphoribosyl transferase
VAEFENRADAGRQLAQQLERFRGTGCVVLGIPRGGLPVAEEVARTLDLPLGSLDEAGSLAAQTVIVVDDGLATGATAAAACRLVQDRGASRIVLAVPVGPLEKLLAFTDADEVTWVLAPTRFWAVGAHYRDFSQAPRG